MASLSHRMLLSLMVVCLLAMAVEGDTVLNRVRRLIDGDDLEEGLPTVGVLAYKNDNSHPRPYFIMCTLVVLDKDWLMTTAHCLDESITPLRDGETLYTVVGLTDNSWDYDPSEVQERPTYEVFEHPDFCSLYVLSNDISLLKLDESLTLNDRVQPIELPPPGIDDVNNVNCKIVGWGIESFPVTEDSFPRYLKEGRMKLKDCTHQFGNALGEDHLCAKGKGVKPCSGDSGAPMFCEVDNESYFLGIDSFGRFDSCENKPLQVLTRIGYFVDFIQDTMANN